MRKNAETTGVPITRHETKNKTINRRDREKADANADGKVAKVKTDNASTEVRPVAARRQEQCGVEVGYGIPQSEALVHFLVVLEMLKTSLGPMRIVRGPSLLWGLNVYWGADFPFRSTGT